MQVQFVPVIPLRFECTYGATLKKEVVTAAMDVNHLPIDAVRANIDLAILVLGLQHLFTGCGHAVFLAVGSATRTICFQTVDS